MIDLLRTRTPKRLGDLDPRVVETQALLRPAAVVVLLERTEGYGVILTKRSHEVEHHKGEISLAGGMRDAGDASLVATALRELDEEIGVPPAAVRVLGRLDDIATVTGFLVTPFVCAIDAGLPMRLQSGEVERVIQVPMRVLRDPAAWFDDIRTWRGDTYHLRSCRFGDDIIWGATSRILQHFLTVIPADVL